MNTFMNNLQSATNFKRTENGALAHSTSNSAVYDLFALGAAYRGRTDADCQFLFKKAYEENADLAMKCLFWIRDCRGGAGERRFFRTCFNWLAKNHPESASRNLEYLAEFGRYDDLYCVVGTSLEKPALEILANALACDAEILGKEKKVKSKVGNVSLAAKWAKSINTSSKESRRLAHLTRKYLNLSEKEYRKLLSALRERIKVLERLMSANRWEEIEFNKIPSKAGLVYRKAFARNNIIAETYKNFALAKDTKVNADTLYPYEIVRKALNNASYYWGTNSLDEVERAMVNKYWENQKDYLNGVDCKMICVCDTSGSMMGGYASTTRPIDVAISLSMYCAERLNGAFKNKYISFASRPQLIDINGIDFVDKVERIYKTNLCDNTNLCAVFDLLKRVALQSNPDDIPETVVVISDMEIDAGTGKAWRYQDDTIWHEFSKENAATEMERIREDWAAVGLKMPKLVYWCVESRQNTVLDLGENVSLVSGCSPTIFKQVITGKTGWDLCLETILADRYACIK